MSASAAHKVKVCPFTLEPCEGCCDLKVVGEKRICPFTFEQCSFDLGNDLRYSIN